jgi:tRNA threonylcarbamoyl adenosine modification protein YeaZ
MRVLAIDTALEACSCAVLDTGRTVAIVSRESRPMVRGHAEALMPLVARVMDAAHLVFSEIDRIAVTTGPGSFTGLRVGISAARGIGLAASRPVVGLTTLAALAAPHIAENDTAPVVVAIDARHEQVYLQAFGPGGRTVISPRVAPLQDAARAVTSASRVVGSGAHLVAALCTEMPALVDDNRAPDIGWVARLGAASGDAQSMAKPLYLRAPDAQPQSAAQLPRR